VLDAVSLRILLAALVGWLDERQQAAVAYLIEENRILRGHVRGRIRLTDEERPSARSARTSVGPSPPVWHRHDRDARYDSPLASAAHRAEMDVREAAGRSSGRTRGDPATRRADGRAAHKDIQPFSRELSSLRRPSHVDDRPHLLKG
jgi:hypothetical protein